MVATALAGLALTAIAWHAATLQSERESRLRFDYRVEDMGQELRGRMLDYEQVLRGAAGMLSVSAPVTAEAWSQYIGALQLQSAYPGMAAVGFAALEGNGAPVRFIHPPGPRNRRALGYDMLSESQRRQAMERARDTAEPVATSPLVLVQDAGRGEEPGFVVYLPVYRRGAATPFIDERRQALVGYVFGSFRTADLLQSTIGATPGIGWRLVDVTDASSPVQLYANVAAFPAAPAYARAEGIVFRGRTWRLEAASLAAFEADAATDRPRVVAIGGISISLLLTMLVWSLLGTRERAETLARRMTAAREELDRFRLAVDRHRDCMLMADAGTMLLVYANEGACQTLGYSRDELLGKPAEIVFADRDRARLGEEYRRLAGNDEGMSIEQATFRRKDGTTVPVEISREVMKTERGTFVLGVARDISDRLAAERAIRESELRLALALENSGLAIFDWNLSSNLVHLGKEWGVIRGGEPAATVTPIQKLEQLVHPDDLPALRERIRDLVRGEISAYRVEHRVRALDGSWKWIESCAKVSERDAAGRALRITGTNADISERRAVGELKNAFIANVSHELRTPLTGIIASVELLREGALGELPPEARRFVDMAHGNGERLANLIDDLLDLERIESGRMHLDLERLELAAILKEATTLNAAYAGRYKASIRVGEIPPGIFVMADRRRLQQVLANLISNAAKNSPADGDVLVEAGRYDGRVVLSVSDRGEGVPEAFVPRLFGKFEQAGAGKKGSTGLGLAVTKSLVDKMGGRIGYRPREGGGACFWVELPSADG